jgi:hypothetical protein
VSGDVTGVLAEDGPLEELVEVIFLIGSGPGRRGGGKEGATRVERDRRRRGGSRVTCLAIIYAPASFASFTSFTQHASPRPLCGKERLSQE